MRRRVNIDPEGRRENPCASRIRKEDFLAGWPPFLNVGTRFVLITVCTLPGFINKPESTFRLWFIVCGVNKGLKIGIASRE